MRIFSALKQDFHDAFGWRPWNWRRRTDAKIESLDCGVATAIAYGNELEKQLCGVRELQRDLAIQVSDFVVPMRIDRIEGQIPALHALLQELDHRMAGMSAQLADFGAALEKVRLRLSAPAAEEQPARPKDWREQRRDLETKFATQSVFEETSDASKGKPS